MLITNILSIPIFLWVASYFAPIFTTLANSVGGIETLAAGQMVTQYGMNLSLIRYIICTALEQNVFSIIGVVIIIILGRYYFKEMKIRELELEEKGI